MRIVPAVRSLLFAVVVLAFSAPSFPQIGISITFGPPALPVYEQPPCPAEGYIWTPGYWAYDYDYGDYYWVPGTWVEVPEVGFLWTPGYWAWGEDRFIFHEGYWGPRVGFYGGIVYGYGYFGEGYEGGRWDNGRFFYNRSVNNVNVTNIHNVYNTTVVNSTTVNRVSYNGGNGGVTARPRPEDEAAARDRHISPVAVQTQHSQAARSAPELRASANHGKPPIAATPKPGAFRDHEVVPAREAGAPYNPPANRARAAANTPAARRENSVPSSENNAPRPENGIPRPPNAVHPRDLPPHPRPAPPNTGDSRQDQKYQQEQEKLYTKQQQDHQKLQQKQEQDHQRLEQQNADEARKQQAEQRHQQQTQQMEQRHTQQQQHLQEKEQPVRPNQPRPPN
jgi:hypothetical protein